VNNNQALAILTVKRTAVNAAINGLNLYRQEVENWKDSVKTAQMVSVKADATTVGADLAAWDGTEPVVAEEESE
jgi:predicted RNA-binding protein with PUA domain